MAAKNATKPQGNGAAENAVPGLAFQIDEGIALPAITRGAPAGREPSAYATAMKALKPVDDPTKYQSFFIPADDVPATITDENERKKWLTDQTRKISNRVSGIARRMQKADANVAFAIRTMTNSAGKTGVRVFRVKAEPKAATAPAAAATTGAPAGAG